MRFSFPYSHAFNDGLVAIEDDRASGAQCAVEFGDGSVVIGHHEPEDDGVILLTVPEYQTSKGTKVRTHSWKLVRSAKNVWRSMRLD